MKCAFLIFLLSSFLLSGKPHLVLYLSDDHSQADSSLYGNKSIPTPHLEKLAAEGMTFQHAYVASPSCAPSRAAMLTGLMPARNGAEGNHTYPNPGTHSLISDLKKAGYTIAAFGKVPHGKANSFDYHFDHLDQHVDYGGNSYDNHDRLKKAVATYLTEYNAGTKPLCLFIGTCNPHVPWDMETKPSLDPASLSMPPKLLDTPATRAHFAAYAQEIIELDSLLGELRTLIVEKLGPDHLFLHTSDHGSQWPFGKWTLYDYGTRVPLVAALPGTIPPGTQTDAMVSWIDLIPTLLDLAGAEIPAGLDGKSFLSVLKDPARNHREEIFTTHTGDKRMNVYPSRAIRTQGWKLIFNPHPEFAFTNHSDLHRNVGAGAHWTEWAQLAENNPKAQAVLDDYYSSPRFELYHVAEDPWELTNLAESPEHKDKLNSLHTELKAWLKEQGDPLPVLAKPRLLKNKEDWHPMENEMWKSNQRAK